MKALIAMSGGVDSSVAAMLAQKAGYECVGCTMQLFDDRSSAADDVNKPADSAGVSDAARVAEALGMPFHVFDLRSEFRQKVIGDFISEYSAGRTPNPCIVCNRHLKFGALLEKATELGCEKIVTGHYARILYDEGTGLYSLHKALDISKDQSYVLYHLNQEQLSRTLLPLGALSKPQVRELAAGAGFVNADRPESQDICFVPDGDYASVIRQYSKREFPPGDFIDLQGSVMGTHKGIIHYTIGQHKRLGQAFGIPRYVCRIDGKKNQITLGGPEDVFSSSTRVINCNWISGSFPHEDVRCKVRLRYRQQEQTATLRFQSGPDASSSSFHDNRLDDREFPSAAIAFDDPQRAITPGQAAVFYDGEQVLGGGTIL